MVVFFILLLLASLWCWHRWTWRKSYSCAAKLQTPSLPALPVVGQAYGILLGLERAGSWAADILSRKGLKEPIDTVCIWFHGPQFIIYRKEDIKKVLNSSTTLGRPETFELGDWITRNGLLTAPVDIWRVKRRLLNPMFLPQNVEKLVPVFNENSRYLVSGMSEHVGRGPVDVSSLIMATSIQTACNLIFGIDKRFDPRSEEIKTLMWSAERITGIATERAVLPWLRSDLVFNFLYRNEIKKIKTFCHGFIDKNLKEKQVTNIQGQNTSDFRDLTMMYDSQESFTDHDLYADIMTFFVTGVDTVGSTISSGLLLLAQYQDVQEKLFQEITSVLGRDDEVTPNDLLLMPYLAQVYKEMLRWASIVPVIIRKAKEDIHLSSCMVPAGNMIALSLAGLHMDPKTFPNPEQFDPDRFSPENRMDKEEYDFIPFSGGPRNCIGKIYADMLVRIVLIDIVRNFKISTMMDAQKMKGKFSIVFLQFNPGFKISLERREEK